MILIQLSKEEEEELKKLASSVTSTSPLYETIEPVGGVIFTSTDLVRGGGYLGSGSKKFKPKKWKAKSLADRVTSKDYGKVRKTDKDKK
jgi:hypothetical protein